MFFSPFLLLLMLNNQLVISQSDSGPVGDVIIYEVGQCNPPINEVDFNFKFLTYENESHGLSMEANIPHDLGDDVQVELVLDKFSNNKWEKDFHKLSGKALEFLNTYFPKVWENICHMVQPNIEDPNIVQAGTYIFDDYKDIPDNIDLPQILYGRFKIYFYLFYEDEEPFTCVMAEIENTQPPP